MLCPHCQNNDPSLFEVDGRLGAIFIIFCKVCSRTFWSVESPKGKV